MKINYFSAFKKNAKNVFLFAGFATLLLSTSCKKEECDEPLPQSNNLDEMISALDLQALPPISTPLDNPQSLEKVELGRLLFWDPIVGGEKDMACVVCHHPGLGYGDGLDLPIGVNGSGLGLDRTENTGGLVLDNPIERVPRNAPTIINSAYNGLTSSSSGYDPSTSPMFWDGRKQALEGQCQGPPTSRSEMRGEAYAEEDALDSVAARVAAIPEYQTLFEEAFGPEGVTLINITKAFAAFERAIVADNSPYDQYLAGDLKALTDDQKEGLLLFNGKARCSNCHFGPMLSDYDFHTMGIPENPLSPNNPDLGKDEDFKFRTPTLRNVSITGPYMHNGMLSSLKEVVEFLNEGVSGNENISDDMLANSMAPLNLTEKEIDQIVAFLESLTDEDFDKVVPVSVPSGLEVGGNIN